MNFRILLTCFIFALCNLSPAMVSAKNFRWASSGDVVTQDPHGQDESFTKSINQMIYERLFQPGKDMFATPWLATGFKVTSPTKRVVTLRRDVKFQDGTPFTADDVVFSFERAAKSNQYKTYAVPAGVARKIDEYTVEFTTAAPNPVGQMVYWYDQVPSAYDLADSICAANMMAAVFFASQSKRAFIYTK